MLPAEVEAFVAVAPLQRRPIAIAVSATASALPRGAQVLDAGAGSAPYRSLFSHCVYVTHDWPQSVHPGGAGADVLSDIVELPLDDEAFDAVICTEVLEHVSRPDLALTELHRVMKPGGTLLVSVPFVNELHEEPRDYFRPTSYGLRALLESSGFVDVDVQPSSGWYSTLSMVMRNAALSTTAVDERPPVTTRLVGLLSLGLSLLLGVLAPALDRRLDRRHALPIGWIGHARRPVNSS